MFVENFYYIREAIDASKKIIIIEQRIESPRTVFFNELSYLSENSTDEASVASHIIFVCSLVATHGTGFFSRLLPVFFEQGSSDK